MAADASGEIRRYSIDTSALIDAWSIVYTLKCFPSFWECIDDLIRQGVIRAAFEVKAELIKQRDEVEKELLNQYEEDKKAKQKAEGDIYRWFSSKDEFFVRRTQDIATYSSEIINRFGRQLIRPTATRTVADPYVIALARADNRIVVTQEKPKDRKVNIPSVCQYYGIRCIDLHRFANEQDWCI